mmetsp:Transcript_23482/g.59517  ORF Transcript_23482/g.59517 Transcript_23482/m.59517 type:complete len:305 (+) Transcript_23482:1660-2574(+)
MEHLALAAQPGTDRRRGGHQVRPQVRTHHPPARVRLPAGGCVHLLAAGHCSAAAAAPGLLFLLDGPPAPLPAAGAHGGQAARRDRSSLHAVVPRKYRRVRVRTVRLRAFAPHVRVRALREGPACGGGVVGVHRHEGGGGEQPQEEDRLPQSPRRRQQHCKGALHPLRQPRQFGEGVLRLHAHRRLRRARPIAGLGGTFVDVRAARARHVCLPAAARTGRCGRARPVPASVQGAADPARAPALARARADLRGGRLRLPPDEPHCRREPAGGRGREQPLRGRAARGAARSDGVGRAAAQRCRRVGA